MGEFIEWYNHRIHGSLWLKIGETPDESLLGLFFSTVEKNFKGGKGQ